MATSISRYLVTFAYIPDEASWCSCTSFATLAKKAEALWEVSDPAFVYYLTTHTGKATAVKMTCSEDFDLWFRGGNPITGKLIAHDRTKAMKVTHSSGLAHVSHRPLIDSLMLSDLGGNFYLRHSALDEVILVGNNELLVWGRAVQKVQRTWSVHRPLFRYMDEVQGERIIISVIDAHDFHMWHSQRRSLLPELTVFEHAAPQLLEEPLHFAVSPPEGTGIPKSFAKPASGAAEPGTDTTAAAAPTYTPSKWENPPELHNPHRVDTLHLAATGRPAPSAAKGPTAGEQQLKQIQMLLQRRTEVAELIAPKPKPAAAPTAGAV